MPLYHWFTNGDRGVCLFFVLSGYVLARPFYRTYRLGGAPVSLRRYFLRRLTRLEPPYLLSLLIYAVAFAVTFHVDYRSLVLHFLASAFYLHNLVYPYSVALNFVAWSLEVEVQFYILAPLLGLIFRLNDLRLRCSIFAALTVLGCFVGAWLPGPPITLLAYAGYFPAGFLLAEILENPARPRRQSLLWDIVGLIGWITIFVLPYSLTMRSFLPLIILPLYVTVFYGSLTSRLLSTSWIAITGGMCYSIYLLHMLLLSVSFRWIKHVFFANRTLTSAVQMLLLLVFIFAVSAVYFVLVERPCMNPRWPGDLLAKLRLLRRNKANIQAPS